MPDREADPLHHNQQWTMRTFGGRWAQQLTVHSHESREIRVEAHTLEQVGWHCAYIEAVC